MVKRIKYIVNIVIVVLIFATVTIRRDGRLLGHDVSSLFIYGDSRVAVEVPIESISADGRRVINSTSLVDDVIGYGGRTPVKLYVKDNVIEGVELEANSETPSFMDEVVKSGLLEQWDGVSLAEAASMSVDGVSGATYSSLAIIENVQRAAQYGADVEVGAISFLSKISLKDIAGLLVLILGLLVIFLKPKRGWLTTMQLLLNVAVLGFWCGASLSLSLITAWIGNGVNLSVSLVAFAMLCIAVVMPLFGKKGTYCQLHCPLGSAQELLGRIPLTKIKIGHKTVKFLNNLRYYILVALLVVMWLGVGLDLMDYELFSAFIFTSASAVVLVMAAIFLILSLFVHRPYCKYVCATGALITMSQKTNG